jgi:UDP-N-acetylglucosamine 2-epimerase (non-hydrolysing)
MKIILVAGARPNFMKIDPILRAIDKRNASGKRKTIKPFLVHTGQHYDYEMSKVFFEELDLPEPDVYLGVGSGTHAEQTGKVMIELEKVLVEQKPHLVLVVGDVNSTLAGALAAVKLHIPVAHVEAGLRSFDREMPEEINRLLTDAISDYLFTPSADADENLIREGVAREKVFLVGDVMVDSLLFNKDKATQRRILQEMGLEKGKYALLTLHRPDNVDRKDNLTKITLALKQISQRIPVIFPCHPRTRNTINQFGLGEYFHYTDNGTCTNLSTDAVHLIAPLGYLDFLQLMMNCRFVMTDSGGIQEETTVLGTPCLTLRNTTERPITISEGTNLLVGNRTRKTVEEAFKILNGKGKKGVKPQLWDGKAAERIVNILAKLRRYE